jgi:hypothetical protein
MKKVGYVALAIVGIIALIALAFALKLGGLEWDRFFKPKEEDVRRETFEKTKSFNEAKLQDLAKYKLQYERAEQSDKEALASTIRHMFADYDAKKLPEGLKSFLTEIRGY